MVFVHRLKSPESDQKADKGDIEQQSAWQDTYSLKRWIRVVHKYHETGGEYSVRMKPEHTFIIRSDLFLENNLSRMQSFSELDHFIEPINIFLTPFGISLEDDDQSIED